jgi:dihydrofolate synthase/folylpolyglutamate synthase
MVSEPWQDGPVGLAGAVQRWNASLAIAAIEAVGLHPGAEVTRSGIARVQWPGRFQQLSADLIVDGAHNPAAAEALVETWCELHPGEKASIVFGALEDKDVGAVLERLAPITAELTLVQVQSPRSIEIRQLREIAAGVFPVGERVCTPQIFEASNLASALARSSGGLRRLVTGSLYLVGEALALHAGTVQERSAQ